jgi:hypothetical protein
MMCEGSGGIALPFFTLALDGGEWSPSLPSRFTLGERSPGTHWMGGWLDPRAGLDAMEKRKIFRVSVVEPWPSSL